MAAICGVIKLDGSSVSQSMGTEMMDKLNVYSFDRLKTFYSKAIFMGCGIQYITPESINEVLPFHDSESGLTITADAIIDNRDELFSLLNISMSERKRMTDSQIILLAFKKWGQECTKYLIGDFAFAIWDEKTKELFCARDHVGKRTFYYYYSKNTFAFCTIMTPLLDVSEDCRKLNDAWIADFLALEGPIHEVDYNQTVYKNIQQLPPAFTMKLNKEGLVKNQYWDPQQISELKLKSDEEYEEAFRKVFFEAVHCRLRSIDSVGVMLSGGLDSGSVACVAAKELAGKGEKLQAFSAIPFADYKDWLPNCSIADERDYIEAIREHAKNIEVTYCRSESKNSITNVEEFIELLEQPYKFIENFFWIDEIVSTASKKRCTVLLDGQFGNLSISYGDIPTRLVSLYRKGKWVTIFREIQSYCKLYNLKYLHVFKAFIDLILPNRVRNIYNSLRGRNQNNKINELMIPVNPELARKWQVEERFKQQGIGSFTKRDKDLVEVRRTIVNPALFSHMGAVDTKISLTYGVARRDPTRDKRVIEFCLSVPGEQYVRQGHERSLIRRAMADILPDAVRLNYSVRGQQSADYIQRLLPMWGDIQKELEEMMQKQNFQSYIDVSKVRRVLKDIGDRPKDSALRTVRMLIVSLIFGRFINRFET